jgi:hypothetical protein
MNLTWSRLFNCPVPEGERAVVKDGSHVRWSECLLRMVNVQQKVYGYFRLPLRRTSFVASQLSFYLTQRGYPKPASFKVGVGRSLCPPDFLASLNSKGYSRIVKVSTRFPKGTNSINETLPAFA